MMDHRSHFRLYVAIGVSFILIDVTAACRGGVLISTGITPQEKTQILDSHNRLRSYVAQGQVQNQPGAENMQEVVWDDELAAKAQQWANECVFQHDPNRYLNRFTMGQNLAIIWSTAPLASSDGDFPSRIQNWFNEVRKYAWGSQWSAATGHYSQLVWGETNLVGCGFAQYYNYQSHRYNKLYVCNYGPGGNVVGLRPYEVGTPSCYNYNMLPSSRYSGLCASSYRSSPGNQSPEDNYINPDNSYTYKTQSQTDTEYNAVYTGNSIKTLINQFRGQPDDQELLLQQQQQQQQQPQQQPTQQQPSNGYKFNKSAFLTYDWSTLFSHY